MFTWIFLTVLVCFVVMESTTQHLLETGEQGMEVDFAALGDETRGSSAQGRLPVPNSADRGDTPAKRDAASRKYTLI